MTLSRQLEKDDFLLGPEITVFDFSIAAMLSIDLFSSWAEGYPIFPAYLFRVSGSWVDVSHKVSRTKETILILLGSTYPTTTAQGWVRLVEARILPVKAGPFFIQVYFFAAAIINPVFSNA